MGLTLGLAFVNVGDSVHSVGDSVGVRVSDSFSVGISVGVSVSSSIRFKSWG